MIHRRSNYRNKKLRWVYQCTCQSIKFQMGNQITLAQGGQQQSQSNAPGTTDPVIAALLPNRFDPDMTAFKDLAVERYNSVHMTSDEDGSDVSDVASDSEKPPLLASLKEDPQATSSLIENALGPDLSPKRKSLHKIDTHRGGLKAYVVDLDIIEKQDQQLSKLKSVIKGPTFYLGWQSAKSNEVLEPFNADAESDDNPPEGFELDFCRTIVIHLPPYLLSKGTGGNQPDKDLPRHLLVLAHEKYTLGGLIDFCNQILKQKWRKETGTLGATTNLAEAAEVVALESVPGSFYKNKSPFCLNYYLSQKNRKLGRLSKTNETHLVPIIYRKDVDRIDPKFITAFSEHKPHPKEHLLADFATPGSIGIGGYELLKQVGKGGFSRVILARQKSTGRLCAMKVISIEELLTVGKLKQTLLERRILHELKHPFHVEFVEAFRTRKFLHLVLEFCPAGELFYHLSFKKRFNEQVARLIICQIILAVELLHAHNISYRDLKPENVLVDFRGHIKLTDFGLCKQWQSKSDLSKSLCGSPEYICPEMLNSGKHSRMVDYYQIGALLYELLTGLPPNYADDKKEMFRRIANEDARMPSKASPITIDLLKSLLCKDPEKRLGFQNEFAEVKAHPFFATVDWQKICLKQEKGPLEPHLSGDYFDSEFVEELTNEEVKEMNLPEKPDQNYHTRFEAPQVAKESQISRAARPTIEKVESSPANNQQNSSQSTRPNANGKIAVCDADLSAVNQKFVLSATYDSRPGGSQQELDYTALVPERQILSVGHVERHGTSESLVLWQSETGNDVAKPPLIQRRCDQLQKRTGAEAKQFQLPEIQTALRLIDNSATSSQIKARLKPSLSPMLAPLDSPNETELLPTEQASPMITEQEPPRVGTRVKGTGQMPSLGNRGEAVSSDSPPSSENDQTSIAEVSWRSQSDRLNYMKDTVIDQENKSHFQTPNQLLGVAQHAHVSATVKTSPRNLGLEAKELFEATLVESPIRTERARLPHNTSHRTSFSKQSERKTQPVSIQVLESDSCSTQYIQLRPIDTVPQQSSLQRKPPVVRKIGARLLHQSDKAIAGGVGEEESKSEGKASECEQLSLVNQMNDKSVNFGHASQQIFLGIGDVSSHDSCNNRLASDSCEKGPAEQPAPQSWSSKILNHLMSFVSERKRHQQSPSQTQVRTPRKSQKMGHGSTSMRPGSTYKSDQKNGQQDLTISNSSYAAAYKIYSNYPPRDFKKYHVSAGKSSAGLIVEPRHLRAPTLQALTAQPSSLVTPRKGMLKSSYSMSSGLKAGGISSPPPAQSLPRTSSQIRASNAAKLKQSSSFPRLTQTAEVIRTKSKTPIKNGQITKTSKVPLYLQEDHQDLFGKTAQAQVLPLTQNSSPRVSALDTKGPTTFSKFIRQQMAAQSLRLSPALPSKNKKPQSSRLPFVDLDYQKKRQNQRRIYSKLASKNEITDTPLNHSAAVQSVADLHSYNYGDGSTSKLIVGNQTMMSQNSSSMADLSIPLSCSALNLQKSSVAHAGRIHSGSGGVPVAKKLQSIAKLDKKSGSKTMLMLRGTQTYRATQGSPETPSHFGGLDRSNAANCLSMRQNSRESHTSSQVATGAKVFLQSTQKVDKLAGGVAGRLFMSPVPAKKQFCNSTNGPAPKHEGASAVKKPVTPLPSYYRGTSGSSKRAPLMTVQSAASFMSSARPQKLNTSQLFVPKVSPQKLSKNASKTTQLKQKSTKIATGSSAVGTKNIAAGKVAIPRMAKLIRNAATTSKLARTALPHNADHSASLQQTSQGSKSQHAEDQSGTKESVKGTPNRRKIPLATPNAPSPRTPVPQPSLSQALTMSGKLGSGRSQQLAVYARTLRTSAAAQSMMVSRSVKK